MPLTTYAPDIYKALNGILMVYKPPILASRDLVEELRFRITDALNHLQPRPISQRLLIEGNIDDEKRIATVPNLADHPLVVGPRYSPFELSISVAEPLSYRSSGLSLVTLGTANRYFLRKFKSANMVKVYEISGRFGYITDNFFADGKIQDKSTYKHIRTGKLDSVLSKIESTQRDRLFDSSSVPLHSQEAYELAKAWPSRPPRMARWPVIYRIRCIHLKLPDFKIEVTVANETEPFLAQLSHDIGLMLKSGAHTTAIRRIRVGPFDVKDSLTDREWDLQSMINNLAIFNSKHKELHQYFKDQRTDYSIVNKTLNL